MGQTHNIWTVWKREALYFLLKWLFPFILKNFSLNFEIIFGAPLFGFSASFGDPKMDIIRSETKLEISEYLNVSPLVMLLLI